MRGCYTVKTSRGANMIAANPQRLTSADGTRWALGRNVKGEVSGNPGAHQGVEVWTLKRRNPATGRAEVVDTHRDRKAAEHWVSGDV